VLSPTYDMLLVRTVASEIVPYVRAPDGRHWRCGRAGAAPLSRRPFAPIPATFRRLQR
jgi:hypothetical protein